MDQVAFPEPSGPERTGLKLSNQFTSAVTNLRLVLKDPPNDVLSSRRLLADWLKDRADERKIIVDGIQRALADPAYLQLHLKHLEGLHFPVMPYEDQIPPDRVKRLLQSGPELFDDGELAWLCLCPEQLKAFRDEISDNLTRFWIDAVDRAMDLAARELGQHRRTTRELMEQVRDSLEGHLKQPMIREMQPEYAQALFLAPMGESSKAKESEQGLIYYRGIWYAVSNSTSHYEKEVTAVLTPLAANCELHLFDTPISEHDVVSIELTNAEPISLGTPEALAGGDFRFLLPKVTPSRLVIEGRVRLKDQANSSEMTMFRVVLEMLLAGPEKPS